MLEDRLIEVNKLCTEFFTDDGVIRAVDNVSFSIKRGEVLGIVGESGCGKSVTALSIMRLVPSPPGRITQGVINFEGRNLIGLSDREYRHIRGNRIAMIFQDPMTSLNPVFTVGHQICEAIRVHQRLNKRQSLEKSIEMLTKVGIPEPKRRMREYPHQFSGGMRQRAMIAMALSCEPELLIADEPTTALDVTIQAQILELMKQLRSRYGMTLMFITHDLGVIAENADNIMVMYAGKVVEKGDVYTIFDSPAHPYTQGLINSIPSVDEESATQRGMLKTIPGIVPNLLGIPPGCRFRERCEFASERCSRVEPELTEIEEGHHVACYVTSPRK
jgi:oligopeptide/dipeptide ABC transporter ATP-binding protein